MSALVMPIVRQMLAQSAINCVLRTDRARQRGCSGSEFEELRRRIWPKSVFSKRLWRNLQTGCALSDKRGDLACLKRGAGFAGLHVLPQWQWNQCAPKRATSSAAQAGSFPI